MVSQCKNSNVLWPGFCSLSDTYILPSKNDSSVQYKEDRMAGNSSLRCKL